MTEGRLIERPVIAVDGYYTNANALLPYCKGEQQMSGGIPRILQEP